MSRKNHNVAVVGVGTVGIEMLRCLRQRNFPVGELRVFARSSRDIEVDGQKYSVQAISPEGFAGIDIALFAGTEGEKGASLTYASEAIKRGAIVIDNGADFRMDPKVPLVVPEVNAKDVKKHKGIIANPNCSTIQLVVALWPIYKKVGIKRVIVTTFQAASGAGRGAVEQLKEEIVSLLASWPVIQLYGQTGKPANAASGGTPPFGGGGQTVLPQQIAFNVFPQIGSFTECDYTNEEWKLVKETHKIMQDNKIKISATCVRVPVRTGHSESVYVETIRPLAPDKARDILLKAPGVVVMDEPKTNLYPMPCDIEGKDEVFVGRVRSDPFIKNGLWLWIVSDNLRKGAALNAVQIAELLIK